MTNLQWKEKTVGIAGCGGLGGYLVEYCLRLGIRHLVVCDGDRFEESNRDRQILCRTDNLGQNKAAAARERAEHIAPEIQLEAHENFLTEENGQELFGQCDLVLDALDSAEGREILRKTCEELHIPMIHGAIGDWGLQVGVILPGDRFPEAGTLAKREESVLSFVPAVCAGLQTAEAVKILRGEDSSLWSQIRYVDLKNLEDVTLPLENE